MRKLILAGLALSVLLADTPWADAETALPWCRIGRHGGGRECAWYTREQCAAATEWQAVGTCFENPNYHPAPAAVPGGRHKAVHHHRHTAD